METPKTQLSVVQGEASESDDEELPTETTQKQETVSETQATTEAKVTVVKGEASESEDEDEEEKERSGSMEGTVIPQLTVNTAVAGDNSDITNGEPLSAGVSGGPTDVSRPKYNSLLHKKLRERNIALRRHLVDTISQAYVSAAKDLHNNTLQLQKTQIAIQDVSHHMSLATQDLFHLEDKVDIVTQCNILPDIRIELPTGTPAES